MVSSLLLAEEQLDIALWLGEKEDNKTFRPEEVVQLYTRSVEY